MSVLRGKISRSRTVDTLLIIGIIISALIIVIPYLLPQYNPGTTLRILTRYDVSIVNEIEYGFLHSAYAVENNIIDIEWESVDSSFWSNYALSGEIDLILGTLQDLPALESSNSLRPIATTATSGVSQTIAGVLMKRYSEGLPIWCAYALRVTTFELFVNEVLLQAYDLSIPETVEDLASADFCPSGMNESLIGLVVPEKLSIEHQFQNVVTKKLGWKNGIQNLTLMYSNSRFYEDDEDALNALLGYETAIALTFFDGQAYETPLWPFRRCHLQNMIVVQPDLIAIADGTTQQSQSEVFIDYLLSPEGQALWILDESDKLPVRREAFDNDEGFNMNKYEEFNWTMRSGGPGVTEWISSEDFALWYYFNSTVFSALDNLTLTWKNVVNAEMNSSIDFMQFRQFREQLGEPLSIIDPISHLNESFTSSYALSILDELYNVDFLVEVTWLWKVAANHRYEMILSTLSALM